MNTYNLLVDGKEVLKKIPFEELEEQLRIVQGLVWTSGGSNENIKIVKNT